MLNEILDKWQQQWHEETKETQIARTFGTNVADSYHIWPRYGMAEHIWAKLSPYMFCHSFKARTHRDEFRVRYSPTFNAS